MRMIVYMIHVRLKKQKTNGVGHTSNTCIQMIASSEEPPVPLWVRWMNSLPSIHRHKDLGDVFTQHYVDNDLTQKKSTAKNKIYVGNTTHRLRTVHIFRSLSSFMNFRVMNSSWPSLFALPLTHQSTPTSICEVGIAITSPNNVCPNQTHRIHPILHSKITIIWPPKFQAESGPWHGPIESPGSQSYARGYCDGRSLNGQHDVQHPALRTHRWRHRQWHARGQRKEGGNNDDGAMWHTESI